MRNIQSPFVLKYDRESVENYVCKIIFVSLYLYGLQI